ncbi:MAG: HD domain-containing protein [Caldisphaera sp.]|jgi:putative hydrolase of HD superfamily|nr:MAG: phosphohydrolase [Caldisphaera sp.]
MKNIKDIVYSLNSLARTGWMLSGVCPACSETVSMHSFASSLIALELSLKFDDVNPYEAASIALIHDIGEATIGDITKGIDLDKKEVENEAINNLNISNLIKELYFRYSERKTKEAIIAKISDLIATYLVALKYEKEGFNIDQIKDSTYNEIINISRQNNIEVKVKNFLSDLLK